MPPDRPVRRSRPVVTGRALVLGMLLIVLVVVLASPLHRYLGSRGDVSQAARQLSTDESELASLTKQKAQWADPGYIQAQARTRLQYAMPGDTVFVVVGPGQSSGLDAAAGSKNASTQAAGTTWNSRLWGSIRSAGAAP